MPLSNPELCFEIGWIEFETLLSYLQHILPLRQLGQANHSVCVALDVDCVELGFEVRPLLGGLVFFTQVVVNVIQGE